MCLRCDIDRITHFLEKIQRQSQDINIYNDIDLKQAVKMLVWIQLALSHNMMAHELKEKRKNKTGLSDTAFVN